MMSGGPRKFSEKIALLNQKQVEGNAAFDSIMCQVKSIKPSSGSQLDILETLNDNSQMTARIDEVIGFNEQVSTTYINEQHQTISNPQEQHRQLTKKPSEKNQFFNKNFEQQTGIFSNNSFLQLPAGSESFRRAHSDSSILQSVTNDSQSCQNFQNTQMNNEQNYVQFQQYNTGVYQPHAATTQNNQQFFHSLNSDEHTPKPAKKKCSSKDKVNMSNESLNYSNSVSPSGVSPTASSTFKQTHTPNSLSLGLPCYNNNNTSSILATKSHQNHFFSDKNKNEPSSPSELIFNNFQSNYIQQHQQQQQLASPGSLSSPGMPSPLQQLNHSPIMNMSQQQIHNAYQQSSFKPHPLQQQQHQQQQRQVNDQLLSPNQTYNNNFLNANSHNTNGGSLPDLSSFQFQNNQVHQNAQLQEYNKRNQPNQYELSSPQLLQPNFQQQQQQHSHVGPVKSTHDNSIIPTRASARYSPVNANSKTIANRRPSPQHLGLNSQALYVNASSVQSSPNTPFVSSPTSPLHPSMQSMPSLEFMVNSQHINSYASTGIVNGASNSNASVRTNNVYGNNNNNNNNQNSNNNNSTNQICKNGNESLPPSPQSQHSCFNSPQGSPDPSLGSQDLSQFNPINNYDIMQKKFDSINLDTSNSAYQAYSTNMLAYGLVSPTHGSVIAHNNVTLIGARSNQMQQQQQHNALNQGISNSNLHNQMSNNGSCNTINNSCNSSNNFGSNGEIASENHSIINSRSGSLSSGSSINNTYKEDDLLNNANTLYQQQQQQQQQQYGSISSFMNKQHKNSIPDIIFTFSSDTAEEKNEIKDLSNEIIIYSEDLLTKNESFDYDLEMLTEPVLDDQSNQTLYQNT